MLSKPDQTPPRLERTTLEKKYKERHDLEFPSKHRYIESNRIRKRVLWVVCVLFAAFFFSIIDIASQRFQNNGFFVFLSLNSVYA
jgi:hypothetical protein